MKGISMNTAVEKTFSVLVVLAITVFLPSLFISCEQGPETITYLTKTDTLHINDTVRIKDTVINFDTLHDTAWIPIGAPPRYQIFGMIYDGMPGDMAYDYDSIYGYCTVFSKPVMREVVATYGNHRLSYTQNQSMLSFFEGYNYNPRIFPSLTNAQYEHYFNEKSPSLACTLKIPYYPSDTAHKLQFDTVFEQAVFPELLDTLLFFDEHGKQYEDVDYYSSNKNIKLDEDLTVVWKDIKADWYAIECIRYNVFSRGAVGLLDTFSIDTQIVVPHEFFFQDSLSDMTKQYDILIVCAVPVNGPLPAAWDSCPSFNGNGHLFVMHYDNVTMLLNASWRGQNDLHGLRKRTESPQPLLHELPGGTIMRLMNK
jgi:hypothetical protein